MSPSSLAILMNCVSHAAVAISNSNSTAQVGFYNIIIGYILLMYAYIIGNDGNFLLLVDGGHQLFETLGHPHAVCAVFAAWY